jgi:hypothetical protein
LLDHMDPSLDLPINVIVNMMTRKVEPSALRAEGFANDFCSLIDRGATKLELNTKVLSLRSKLYAF